jgi:RNA polymerase sigma-70 factor (ECF subfamily)
MATSGLGAERAASCDRIRWQLERNRRGVEGQRFQAHNPGDNAADRDPLVARAVVQARAGDREALGFLYQRYSSRVFGYVMSIVHDEHEAEDVTQAVFLKLMSALELYEPRQVPFAAWIIRVARNAAYDHIRDRRSVPCEEVFGSDDRADTSRHDHRRALQQALATLPEDQRTVLLLRHLYGYSPGEIAERMGKTAPSIHGLHHRGRQSVRVELSRLGAVPATA